MRTGTAVRWLVIGIVLAVGGCNKSNPNSHSGNTGGAPTANAPANNSSAGNSTGAGAPVELPADEVFAGAFAVGAPPVFPD